MYVLPQDKPVYPASILIHPNGSYHEKLEIFKSLGSSSLLAKNLILFDLGCDQGLFGYFMLLINLEILISTCSFCRDWIKLPMPKYIFMFY